MINKGRRKKTLNEVELGKATHKNNLSFPEKYHIPRKSLFHRKVDAYDLEFFLNQWEESPSFTGK